MKEKLHSKIFSLDNIKNETIIESCQRSTTAVQFTCNEQVGGSNPLVGFGEKMAGKGDTYRQVDQKKWDENWERVFGDKHRKRNASSNAKSVSQRKKKTTTNNKRKRQGVDQSNTERKKQ